MRVRIEHVDDGEGEDGEAHAHGQGDDCGDAQGGLGDLARAGVVPRGHGGRDGGHDGDGERRDEGRGEVIKREHGGIGAIERVGQVVAEPGVQQADVDEIRVQQGDHAHDGRAEGDGHTDFYKLGEGAPGALRHVRGVRQGAVWPALDGHVDERGQRAGGDAEDGAGGGHGHALARVQQPLGQRKADDDLYQHLQHLPHGGGAHVCVALDVAAVGAGDAHQQHRRGQGEHALRAFRRVYEDDGHLRGEEQHQRGEQRAQHGQRDIGHAEGAAHLVVAPERAGSGDHARERHGQSRGGDGEQDVIYAVGGVEIAVAGVAEYVAERYLIDGAEYLHDDDARGEDGRAVEIVLLFGFRQWYTSHQAAVSARRPELVRRLLTLH